MSTPVERKTGPKRPRFKLQGCLVAVSGAFVWMYNFTSWTGLNAVLISAYAVLVASWFVIPIGFTLGYLLPSFVACSSKPRAAVVGVAIGVLTGVVAGLLTKFTYAGLDYSHLPSMILVCGIWVGLWAIRISQTAPASERKKISGAFREWLDIGKDSET